MQVYLSTCLQITLTKCWGLTIDPNLTYNRMRTGRVRRQSGAALRVPRAALLANQQNDKAADQHWCDGDVVNIQHTEPVTVTLPHSRSNTDCFYALAQQVVQHAHLLCGDRWRGCFSSFVLTRWRSNFQCRDEV
jgi:hypothetical protein